jgi:high-affinity iron transporter
MVAGALITFREGLVAFLIVGILLGYLPKVGQPRLKLYVWLGAAAGVLSAGVVLVLQRLAVELEGTTEALSEGATER